jgi:hypothetical protein
MTDGMRVRALLVSLLALVVFGSSVACKRRNRAPQGAPVFSQSYATENGLVTVRYPSDFAAKKLSANSILVARNLGDGTDEAIAFTAIAKPITDDLNEYARVVLTAEVKSLQNYTETSKKASSCGPAPSIETIGRWGSNPMTMYERHSCIFLFNGHGYSIGFSAPERRAATEVPLLEQIRQTADVH